jgi:hypothetical protein
MRFVLTGNANIGGNFVNRRDLIARIHRAGDGVVDSFTQGADALVASREDTSKAVQARALGKPVWTFAQLDSYLHIRETGGTQVTGISAVTGRATLREPRPAPRQIEALNVTGLMDRLSRGVNTPAARAAEPVKKVEPHPSQNVLSNGRRFIDL